MDLDEFSRQFLALRPSKAKSPKAGIRSALRYDFLGKSLLFLDNHTLIPLRLAMPGVRFRLEPEPARIRQRHAAEIQIQNQALAYDLHVPSNKHPVKKHQ